MKNKEKYDVSSLEYRLIEAGLYNPTNLNKKYCFYTYEVIDKETLKCVGKFEAGNKETYFTTTEDQFSDYFRVPLPDSEVALRKFLYWLECECE